MFSSNMTWLSPWPDFLHYKKESFLTFMMTHATLELNENLINKTKYIHGSLKLTTLMKKINIHITLSEEHIFSKTQRTFFLETHCMWSEY